MATVGSSLGEDNRFTPEAVAFAVNQVMAQLTRDGLERWRAERRASDPMVVGVLEPGNVPLAGLQDYLAVLLTGHAFVGLTSTRSPYLLPAFAREVTDRGGPEARFVDRNAFFGAVSAVVASGTDDTRQAVASQCEAAAIGPARRLLRGFALRCGRAGWNGE